MNNLSDNTHGALFDLDGVLIDTETLYTQFWDQVGQKYTLPSPTFAYDIKGTTLNDILTRYFPDPTIRQEIVQLVHDFEDNIVYPVFDGVTDFLDRLEKAGWRTAIVTSSDDTKMKYLYSQLPWFQTRFDAVVTGSMVTRSKPDPEGYLKAAQLIGCRPENCVVFEDSFQGLEAGRRAGGKVVALATTNPREKLINLADIVINNFRNLKIEIL